jgi:hypothetical protein
VSVVGSFDSAQSGPVVGGGLVELGGQRFAFESGECVLARGDGRGGLLTAGRFEVVARTDGGEPRLMAGEVGVGLLEFGARAGW